MVHILKCENCKSYGLDEVCKCGGVCVRARPMKYSPEDKYASYRRKVKFDEVSLDE